MLAQTLEQSESLSTKKIATILVVGYIVAGLLVVTCMRCYYDQELDTNVTPTPRDEVVIRYSDTITRQLGMWTKADPGYVFLVLDLDIENQGYESVDANPFSCSVVINKVEYDASFITVEGELKYVKLLDGGRTTGKVLFEVPEEVINVGYQPRYETWPKVYVVWIKQ